MVHQWWSTKWGHCHGVRQKWAFKRHSNSGNGQQGRGNHKANPMMGYFGQRNLNSTHPTGSSPWRMEMSWSPIRIPWKLQRPTKRAQWLHRPRPWNKWPLLWKKWLTKAPQIHGWMWPMIRGHKPQPKPPHRLWQPPKLHRCSLPSNRTFEIRLPQWKMQRWTEPPTPECQPWKSKWNSSPPVWANWPVTCIHCTISNSNWALRSTRCRLTWTINMHRCNRWLMESLKLRWAASRLCFPNVQRQQSDRGAKPDTYVHVWALSSLIHKFGTSEWIPFCSAKGKRPTPAHAKTKPGLVIGSINPTGLMHKSAFFSELPASEHAIWGASETHLTQQGVNKFKAELKVQQKRIQFLSWGTSSSFIISS